MLATTLGHVKQPYSMVMLTLFNGNLLSEYSEPVVDLRTSVVLDVSILKEKASSMLNTAACHVQRLNGLLL